MEKVGAFTERATAEGEWRPGNPSTGQQATPMLADWFNMLQRELLQVLADGGVTPDVNDETQLVAAIRGLLGQYGIGNSIKLGSSDDLDAVTDEGIYAWSGVVPANSPFGADYGAMLVIADPVPCQVVLGGPGGQFFQRRKNSGTWSGWTDHRNASTLNAGTLAPARLPGATTTEIGAIEKATAAEALAGAAGKYPDAADMRAAIDAGAAYQNIAVFDTAGTTSWSVPQELQDGRRVARVTVVGGGGGGASDSSLCSGGGGSGVAIGLIDLSSVASVDVTVGAGGAGAATVGTAGNNGGSSSFGAYLSASGGEGGKLVNSPSGPGSGTGGDINVSGSDGQHSKTTGSGSTVGGSGGETLFGGSGSGGTKGRNARAPGAGGGGGSTDTGGDGYPGIVIVEW